MFKAFLTNILTASCCTYITPRVHTGTTNIMTPVMSWQQLLYAFVDRGRRQAFHVCHSVDYGRPIKLVCGLPSEETSKRWETYQRPHSQLADFSIFVFIFNKYSEWGGKYDYCAIQLFSLTYRRRLITEEVRASRARSLRAILFSGRACYDVGTCRNPLWYQRQWLQSVHERCLRNFPAARDYSSSFAGIAASKLAASICMSCWVSRVVRYRSLRRADPSSRGVLPTVVCHCVWSRNLNNEAALARVGLLCQEKKK